MRARSARARPARLAAPAAGLACAAWPQEHAQAPCTSLDAQRQARNSAFSPAVPNGFERCPVVLCTGGLAALRIPQQAPPTPHGGS
eukprot:5281779-Alexandrium_andersonii.AAC.1